MVSKKLKHTMSMEHALACLQLIAEVALLTSQSQKVDKLIVDIMLTVINNTDGLAEVDLFYEAK
ncbi:hypothetical protein [Vagococcus sp. WN89Y]|uniref:hypothetical protein n=1 Tax=Vagococcus sp. WN89Y TaxID=3457258 RepID=UPI003FCE671D